MGLFSDVSDQMKEALRAKQATRLAALRSIRAVFLNETKKDNADTLPDDVCVGLLRRLEKQRHESIEAFDQAGRDEQAAAERAELAVIQEFLPSLADEATTRAWVEEAIAATGAGGPKELGRVMSAIMKDHKGDIDGNLARKLASDLLGE
jgi:uncharacterized protein YqeY